MANDEMSALSEMRRERGTYQAVYVQLANYRKFFSSHAFCFYEGEDGKYYNMRIENVFANNYITFTVGNKKEVLKLLNKIKSTELYDNVCMMFFVDRDYDLSLAGTDECLYETPCYSIENLYVQKECFQRILQSEFGIDILSEDYNKCVCDFEQREEEFNTEIMEFNALAYLRRKKTDSNSECSFKSVKTSHLVLVTLNQVSKASRYDKTISEIKEKIDFTEQEFLDAKNQLIKQGEFSLNFRGKNQLDFFVSFINELKNQNGKTQYFSEKYNNIHINITANRLSELSQYAVTPISLNKFLHRQYERLISIQGNVRALNN